MNAKEELYGSHLSTARVARIILTYEIGVGAFTYVLYSPKNLLWIVGWMIASAIYVYRVILPRGINANYSRHAETERNRFLNIVTQGMTSKNANIVNVLENASKKAEGEFKLDLEQLLATLLQASSQEVQHQAFLNIEHKYSDDIYFGLFMEQVETVYYESQYHPETFKTFEMSHNTLLSREREFIRRKKARQAQLLMMSVISLAVVAICLYSNGYSQFIKIYATKPTGYAVSTVYLLIMAFIYNGFYKRYYDDNVTSY